MLEIGHTFIASLTQVHIACRDEFNLPKDCYYHPALMPQIIAAAFGLHNNVQIP